MTCLGRIKADVEAEIEHEKPHGKGCPDEAPAPSESVGKECDENGARAHLDDAVDAGREERLGIACDTKGLEDLGSVVVYCVCLVCTIVLASKATSTDTAEYIGEFDAPRSIVDRPSVPWLSVRASCYLERASTPFAWPRTRYRGPIAAPLRAGLGAPVVLAGHRGVRREDVGQ